MRPFLLALSVLALGGCTTSAKDSSADDTSGGDPDTAVTFDDTELATSLWSAMTGYDAWPLPDGWSDTPVLSDSHMGGYVVAYFNDTLAGWNRTGEAPAGSISVKENYGDEAGTALMNLTVMQKVTGYDADHSDWFWAEYDPDGTLVTAGKVDMCWGCHAGAPHDYVYADPPTAK